MNNLLNENSNEKTFLEMLKTGECNADDIDIYIEKWHDEYNGPLKLHEYLGMTEKQYEKWLKDPKALYSMIPSK